LSVAPERGKIQKTAAAIDNDIRGAGGSVG
jgi:hypothetical protein